MTLRPAALFLLLAATASAQKVSAPQAAVIDVPGRQAFLRTTNNPLILSAIKSLHSCVNSSLVPAPTGRIEVPHHYLTGSNGPTNPAEAAATRVYAKFEERITAGMNQYLATGSHAEAACALAQLDVWAQAKALLDYDPQESSQAWYQVEWTLSAAGVTDSVLVTDTTLDAAQQTRVTQWLDKAAHKLVDFERPGRDNNNHHYWRALAATSIGVAAADNNLFQFGINTYKEAVRQLDPNGAFPLEMARHERSLHYQGFALQPLIVIAEFAARQNIDLYVFQAHGRTIRDAIFFFGHAIDDPKLILPYTSDPQMLDMDASDYAPFVFFAARFGTTGLPPSLIHGLQQITRATRIGGNTTVLAAK